VHYNNQCLDLWSRESVGLPYVRVRSSPSLADYGLFYCRGIMWRVQPSARAEGDPTHASNVLNIGLVGVLWHRLSGKYL
jgi:hypothetical protein